MTLQPDKRIRWIDIAKCITIILVVLGHTLRGGAVQQIVYSFHVSLFFFLSGMTCGADNFKNRIKNDFLRIMVPYYFFGLTSIVVFVLLGHIAANQFDLQVETSIGTNLLELICACPKGNRMKFNMPLWFLPCLFVTKLLFYGIMKLFRRKQAFALGGSFVLATGGVIYTRLVGISLPFNLNVSVKMLFFFVLGNSVFKLMQNQKEATKMSAFFSKRLVQLVLGIVALICTGVVACVAPKVNYSGDTFPHVGVFLFTSCMGSGGICLISMAISRCNIAEYIGRNTLSVLVMHKFPVLLFQVIQPTNRWLLDFESIIGTITAVCVSFIAVGLCLMVGAIMRKYVPFLFGDFRAFSRMIKKST